MSGFVGPQSLAPPGSTSNNTHAGVSVSPTVDKVVVDFICEVAGGSPTVTWTLQGSLEKESIVDGSVSWQPVIVLPSNSDTATASPPAVTAVGHNLFFISQAQTRFYRRLRIVTTANTNITYRAELTSLFRN